MTRRALALFAFAGALALATPARASDTAESKTILFVCLHGSVKSQVAAAHFNRIAKERGLPYTAISRGIEADSSIPVRIRDNLNLDGLEPLDDVPQPLTPVVAADAVKVIAFDAVPDDKRGVAEVNYWSDVPRETLRGVVTGIDERNDSLTVRLASNSTSDFRVQDRSRLRRCSNWRRG